MFVTSIFLIGLLSAGTYERKPGSPHVLRGPTALDNVASGGIDEFEALLIGDVYFAVNSHCGNFSGLSDGGSIWILSAESTFSGKALDGFSIDKMTGRIYSQQCTSYERPEDIVKNSYTH